MPDDIDELITIMAEIWKHISRQSRPQKDSRAATFYQFYVLRFLQETPNCTIGKLGREIGSSVSATTQLVSRLSASGLIDREIDKKDRREVHLKVSQKGMVEISRKKEQKRVRLKEIFSNLSNRDLKELLRIEKELLASLREG